MAGDAIEPIVEEGRNCWRIARAEQASLIVDAADYYRIIRAAMIAATSRIFIVGWDFDTRVALEPDEHGKGEPLGRFFLDLARDRPQRQIDILKWNFGALKQFLHLAAIGWLLRWWRSPAIDYRFDSSHPVGCSHHQKIVVIDDCLAACGGIDIAGRRWDTPGHVDGDGHRTGLDGKPYMPWHDATMMMRGEVAGALSELGRERWKVATKGDLKPIAPCDNAWPDGLDAMFTDVDVAIARTRAPYDGLDEVREIETLYLDMICAAKRFIYFENQYFTSGKIAAAIAQRMEEANPPEIVLVMPRTADGWLEQKAMDGARLKLVAAIGERDPQHRFRVYVPVTEAGEDIYVHAKIAIVDDRLLRVGSSNLNNRSQGLDSECDVVIDAGLPANANTPAAITALRHRLLAEHLGCGAEAVAEAEAQAGSMTGAIEALSGSGKTLELLTLETLGAAEDFIASNEILDPESADEMFDPIGKHGLRKSWAEGRAAVMRRLGRGAAASAR